MLRMTSETEWLYPHCILLIKVWNKNPDNEIPVWERIRSICGPTDPNTAGKDTIRGRFARPNQPIRYNVVHSPDSRDAAIAFAKRWVPKEE